MAPQILIVGEHSRRAALLPRVEVLGYEVEECEPEVLGPHLEDHAAPATIIVCVADIELPMFMARVRRNRASAAIPIVLCGRLGGVLAELTDVLDLGADHFLEEPVRDEPLRLALDALAGPGTSLRPPRSWEGLEDAPKKVEPLVFKAVRPTAVTLGLRRTPAAADSSTKRAAPREAPASRWGGPPAHDGPQAHAFEAANEESARIELDDAATRDADDPSRGDERAIDEVADESDEGSAQDDSFPRLVLDNPRRELPVPLQPSGTLRRVEVPRLLHMLRERDFHGRLELTRGRVRKDAWFEHGVFAFAQSNSPRERLVESLRGSGKLPVHALDEARRHATPSPVDDAKRLLAGGWLKPEELGEVLVSHGRSVIAATFSWNRGHWALYPDEPSPVGGAAARDLGLERWIFSGVVESVDRAQLWSWLGGGGSFARLRPDALVLQWEELVSSWGLDPRDAAPWLGHLRSGAAPLRALIESPDQHDPQPALALVYTLLLAGIVELHEQPPTAAGRAPEEIDRGRIDARLRLVRGSDYFEVLGVPRSARRTDVLRAYRGLAEAFDDRSLHPVARDERAEALAELRTGLSEARDVLADDTLRNAYLAHLDDPDERREQTR